MKFTKSEKTIYTTQNYDLFIFPDWNRDIAIPRVTKMVESIKKVGWLPQPALVNEKFEVIDGQSRIKALEYLKMPVEFIIMPGIGREECQNLNRFQKNWTTRDFIDSYISEGNENYIWLKEMLSRYKVLTANVVMAIARAKGEAWSVPNGSRDSITDGSLCLTNEEKNHVENVFFYLSRFSDTANFLGGRKDVFYSAVLFMSMIDGVDKERLCAVVNNARFDGMVSSGTVEGWLQQLEFFYNKKLRKDNKVDVVHRYRVAS